MVQIKCALNRSKSQKRLDGLVLVMFASSFVTRLYFLSCSYIFWSQRYGDSETFIHKYFKYYCDRYIGIFNLIAVASNLIAMDSTKIHVDRQSTVTGHVPLLSHWPWLS